MILQSEIIALAAKNGVPTSTVDKNWVLGHFIAGLFRQPWAQEKLIFKGGTCLKKCYFPDYRFSEDIDFTFTDKQFLITGKLLETVCDNVTKSIGIQFSKVVLEDVLYENKKVGYEATIRFWGANHKRSQITPPTHRWLTAIKAEFTFYEIIVNPPLLRSITGDYSDMNTMNNVPVPCYSITEIVAEKFRSLLQRSYPAPRDYYDLWYLVPHLSDGNIKIMLNTFQTKAQFKGVNLKSYHDFFDESQIKKMQRAWKNSLEEHLSPANLPSVETVISELKQFCLGQNWTNHLKQ